MLITKNFNFNKPEGIDNADISVLNENTDYFDTLFAASVGVKSSAGATVSIPDASRAIPAGVMVYNGKNIIDVTKAINNDLFYVADGSQAQSATISVVYVLVAENTDYVISKGDTANYIRCAYVDKNNAYINRIAFTDGVMQVHTPVGTRYLQIAYDIACTDIQIEHGTEASEYEAHQDSKDVTITMKSSDLAQKKSAQIKSGEFIQNFPLYMYYGGNVITNDLGLEMVFIYYADVKQMDLLTTAKLGTGNDIVLPSIAWTTVITLRIPKEGKYKVDWNYLYSAIADSCMVGSRIKSSIALSKAVPFVRANVVNQNSCVSEHFVADFAEGETVKIDLYSTKEISISNIKLTAIRLEEVK